MDRLRLSRKGEEQQNEECGYLETVRNGTFLALLAHFAFNGTLQDHRNSVVSATHDVQWKSLHLDNTDSDGPSLARVRRWQSCRDKNFQDRAEDITQLLLCSGV